MARTRRRSPYNPAKAHDRRATEFNLGIGQHVAPIEVDDPMEVGAKLIVMRSVRDDPLGRMHDRKMVDEAQYQAGREFQKDFETAERGPCAIDPSKEFVDGGMMPEPITESQRKAVMRLNRAERELGQSGASITHDVLVRGLSITQVGQRREMTREIELKYLGRRFRECLDCLAVLYGYAMEKR